jgi:hypothetical protein
MIHNMTMVHIEFPLHSIAIPYPSALQHEGRSHANHICVPVYIDVLHECQVVLHADLDSSLLLQDDSTKSNLTPSVSYVQYDPYSHHHI